MYKFVGAKQSATAYSFFCIAILNGQRNGFSEYNSWALYGHSVNSVSQE